MPFDDHALAVNHPTPLFLPFVVSPFIATAGPSNARSLPPFDTTK
jgi:hypothetical protein